MRLNALILYSHWSMRVYVDGYHWSKNERQDTLQSFLDSINCIIVLLNCKPKLYVTFSTTMLFPFSLPPRNEEKKRKDSTKGDNLLSIKITAFFTFNLHYFNI